MNEWTKLIKINKQTINKWIDKWYINQSIKQLRT